MSQQNQYVPDASSYDLLKELLEREPEGTVYRFSIEVDVYVERVGDHWIVVESESAFPLGERIGSGFMAAYELVRMKKKEV